MVTPPSSVTVDVVATVDASAGTTATALMGTVNGDAETTPD